MADAYDVVSQRQTTDIGADGRFVQVVEITFTTKPSGITLVESVPLNQYTLAYVEPILDARARLAEDVQNH